MIQIGSEKFFVESSRNDGRSGNCQLLSVRLRIGASTGASSEQHQFSMLRIEAIRKRRFVQMTSEKVHSQFVHPVSPQHVENAEPQSDI